MRWLTRLLHASGSTRHFLMGSVIVPRSVMRPVVSRPPNPPAISEAVREAAGAKPAGTSPRPTSPLPAIPQLETTSASTRNHAQSKPGPAPSTRHFSDPRLHELKHASSAKKRQEAALKHPELRPPHDALTYHENTILELAYWQGLTYREVGERLGFSSNRALQICNKALRRLTYHLLKGARPGTATHESRNPPCDPHLDKLGEDMLITDALSPQAVVLGEDIRITALRRLGQAEKRREVAQRYPELRPPHACLSKDENDLLELSLWQARTFGEITSLSGLSRKQVATGVRQALEKLNQHLCRESHQDEDHLDAVLLALNECGSVRRAAKKLKVGKDVLKTFMERVGIRTRTVFEVDTGEPHHQKTHVPCTLPCEARASYTVGTKRR
jgi:DNA-directed RNA polymerase specialized sigma24 family protein